MAEGQTEAAMVRSTLRDGVRSGSCRRTGSARESLDRSLRIDIERPGGDDVR